MALRSLYRRLAEASGAFGTRALPVVVVHGHRNLLGRNPDDLIVAPHGHRVAVALVLTEGLPHRSLQRAEHGRLVIDKLGRSARR
jgi:hypothetical protein